MDLNFALQFEFGDTPQILAQDFSLDLELMLVVGLLVMASAAAAKMLAWRRDAVRRCFHHRFSSGSGKPRFFFGERRFDFLSGENERDEDGLAASAVFIAGCRGRKSS
jgi:hypothetical protein